MRAYSFKMYPSKSQEERLFLLRKTMCSVYNSALEQRRWLYCSGRKQHISFAKQSREIKDIREFG